MSGLPAHAKITKTESGGFLAVVKPTPRAEMTVTAHHSKGSEPAMPAAVDTKPKRKTVAEIKNTRSHEAPRHILPTLKAFRGPNAGKNAFAASQVLLAAMGRLSGERNVVAEAFCNSHGYEVLNVATESNPTSGGFLTPNPLSAAVVELKAKVGVSRQLAEVVPMTSEYLGMPKETGGYTVQYPDEGGTISTSDLTWGLVNLSVTKRVVLGFASNEMMDDSVIAFTDIFASRAAHALAAKEDDEFCNADGTSTYGGEVGLKGAIGAGGIHTAATGHDTWPELDIADFTGVMGKLPSRFSNGGESWLCSPQFYALAMLKAVGGANQGFDAEGRPLFLGKPVFLTSKAPTTAAASTICCYYGSFSEGVMIGDRVGFALSLSRHAKFDYDLTALKLRDYEKQLREAGGVTKEVSDSIMTPHEKALRRQAAAYDRISGSLGGYKTAIAEAKAATMEWMANDDPMEGASWGQRLSAAAPWNWKAPELPDYDRIQRNRAAAMENARRNASANAFWQNVDAAKASFGRTSGPGVLGSGVSRGLGWLSTGGNYVGNKASELGKLTAGAEAAWAKSQLEQAGKLGQALSPLVGELKKLTTTQIGGKFLDDMAKSAVNAPWQLPGLLGAGVEGMSGWKRDEAKKRSNYTERSSLSFAESGTVESYRQQAAIRKQSNQIEQKQLSAQQTMVAELKEINRKTIALQPMNLRG